MYLRSRVNLLVVCGLLAALGAPRTVSADATRIVGKVVFDGGPGDYKRVVLDTSKDPNCKKAKPKIGSENVVLNTKTDPVTVRNVLVAIKDGLGDAVFPTPSTPVTLTQVGCTYEPHVLGIVEGQPLKILNGDETNHNIHFLPEVNEEINFTQPKKDLEAGKEVKLVAEKPFKVKCDVHPWMGCHVGVFKHPFFSVTDTDGTFELKGMPGGKYVIEAWHEEFGTLTAEVNVATGETAEADLTYKPKPGK